MTSPLPLDAKIALLSPRSWGNLGDAAIIESLIDARRLFESVRSRCGNGAGR